MNEYCGKCSKPGNCCKAFYVKFPKYPWAFTRLESREKVIRRMKKDKLPFEPVKVHGSNWIFKCTKLSVSGRCMIYSGRPDVCRDYDPKTGNLCPHNKNYKPIET